MPQTRITEIRSLVVAAAFAALTGVGAWISIPLSAVPITLQVLFVYLAGLLLPPRYAFLSMIIYLLMGIIGLPVFASGGSGIAVVVGPTGGYLFGFAVAAFIISALTQRLRREAKRLRYFAVVSWCIGALVVGAVVIFSMGAGWGKISTGLAWEAIITGWVLPFIPGDLVKMAVATVIASEVWRRDLVPTEVR